MRYESNECCGCAAPGYPCLGNACPLRHVIRWKCDRCGCDELGEEDMFDECYCMYCADELGLIEDDEADEDD